MKIAFMARLLAVSLIAITTACTTVSSNTDSNANSGGFYSSVPSPRITIPSGARLRVVLIDAVSATKSAPGDEFLASMAEPVIIDGKMVLEKGMKVRGRVVDVNEFGEVQGRASIRLILTGLIVDSKHIAISTRPSTKGKESHYPPETRLNFTLADSVEI